MDHTDRGLLTTMIIIGVIIIILLLTRGSIGTAYTSYNYRAGNGLTASAVPFDDTGYINLNTQPTYYSGSTSVRALSRPSTTAGTRTTTYYTYSSAPSTTYTYPGTTTYYSDGCAAGYVYSETTGAPCYQAMN